MKKYMAATMIFCLLLSSIFISGCGFKRKDYDADIKLILECAANKDVDTLYDKFSEEVKTNTPDLREKLQDFVDYYDGELVSYRTFVSKTGEGNGADGRYCRETRGYEITTSEAEYLILLVNYSKAYTEDGLGWVSLGIGLTEYVDSGHSLDQYFVGAYVVSPETEAEKEAELEPDTESAPALEPEVIEGI